MLQYNYDTDLKIILTHIPKCAGTSFRQSIIAPNIPESMWYRPGSFLSILTHKKDFRYIIGHFPLGIEKYIHPLNPAKKRNTIRIIFLREPVDHMISYYYFQLQLGKQSKYYPQIKKQDIIAFYQKNYTARNLQTRFCAGILSELIFRKVLINSNSNILLKCAKKNFSKFDFIGSFENINNDMKTFAEKYSLNYKPVYSKSTKTNFRPKPSELKPKTQKMLKQINQLDIALYDFAKHEFWK
jgi:hypothetical protein